MYFRKQFATIATIDRQLADYKQVASDLRVGVNHLALDEERLRQEQFLQGLVDLQHRIFENEKLKERYGDEIEDLKNGIRLNADVLSYLKSITKLEGPFTELTNKIAQAAVAASSPNTAPQTVFANKALTENVNNCWEYIAQLSAITQIHLRDAASYHQFHHMANEIDAHIDKVIGLAEMKMLLFNPQGTVDEAVLLAQELEGDHVELARTWEQTCQLTEMARHLKSVQNRLARVVSGRTVDTPSTMAQKIVMVKALINLSGPDFAIRKGEEMILMNNENPNFWRVKTTFGEREVPSLIFSTISQNQEEVFKANSLQKKCVSDWKRVLERTKGKLVKYYTTLFERYCQNDTIYFAHEDAMNDFLDDLDSILIAPNYDSGILYRAYHKFTNTLMLLSPAPQAIKPIATPISQFSFLSANRRPPHGAISLNESDIRALHAPLRRVLNQTTHLDQLQARVSMSAEEVQRYLKSVEDERQHIFNEISKMEQLQKEKENQLKRLQQRMDSWKTKRKAFDRAISDYNTEPMEGILKDFPATPLPKPRMFENDYRQAGDHYETDLYEASSSETQSSSDYGQVAKQLVTSHTRPKANEVKFAGGVVQDEKGEGKVWSGKTVCLKRSVSTNDLQTQILRVTMNTGVQYDQEDHKRVFADISELRRNDQMISTSDVQAQILKVTRNATSQVGVRVTPKAIDLSRVDIENLGLEVQNSKETEGLGFRVGEVLCPVSVGTSVDLYEGPGVQVLGINDVDSLNLEMRNIMAHATKDCHRRLKVRDIQSQIVTRESSESARSKAHESSEIQTHIGVMNKTAGIQAVAKMEVVNIPSQKRKNKVSGETSTAFCLLPDKESTGTMSSKAATSDVITQISCILHSRGIHSDLQTYLSEYKKRSNLSETSDLGAPMQNVGLEWIRQPIPESQYSSATYDVETLISRVVRDYGTQVSSRLIPAEVTVTKINTKNMDVSFSNPLKEFDIKVPVDSFICPADMKFETELYEGSELSIADYSGVSNLIVTHGDEVAIGSLHLGEVQVDSVDMQKHYDRDLKTQAAIVLRAKDPKSKARIGEVTAQSGVAPKVHFVVSEITGRPFRYSKTPQSDLQTQISYSTRALENRGRSVEFFETEADFSRRNESILQEYSTPRNELEVGQESVSVVREVICAKCQKKNREIQSGYDETDSEQNSVQTQISYIVASKGIQPQSNEMESTAYSSHRQRTDSEIQVGLELIPTQISMNRHDIENMEMEFLDATEHESYSVKVKSVSCPAKIKVEARLTDGSGVHISGIEKVSRVGISVNSSMPSKLADGVANIESKSPDILCEEFQTEVNFEYASTSMPEGKQRSSKSTQKKLVRLIPCGVAGSEMKTSGVISQVLSVTSDSSMQVGSRLVPLAIGISPVQLENMEISLTNLGKSMSKQTLSASAVLYPAQVELQSNLIDGQSGIELVPIEQLKVIHMNSSKSEAMVQYSSSSSDVLTQIMTKERPNLLPASIVMETGQFDGHNRTPNIASQSMVCDLFKNRMRNQTISIRAKPTTSEYSSGKPSSCFGYVSNEVSTQTADTSIENIREEFYIAADKPSQRVKQHAIGVQVGMKLIPQVLKLSQIPVKNMKLESSFSSSGQRESLSLQSVRCPAEVAMKSELCDDSGIVICSLDQSGEIEVEMACDSLEPRIGTKEQSFSKQNRVDGWWSRIVSGKTPLSENKSLENATIGKSAEGTITTAQKPIMVENSMFLQAEAILQPETSAHHPNPRYKLVMVDSSIQNTSRSLRSSVSPDRQYSSVSAAKPDWSDRSVQVGVKLTPNSIEVRPLKLENMEAVLTSKTTRVAREVDVSAILCTSGVQYEEELTETTGVQVVQINESADLSLDYCGNKFATSVTSNKKRGSVITSTDRSRQFGVGIIKARTEEPNTTPDADDCEIITTLRVKEAQYTTKNNLTGGYWEGTRTPSEETAFVRRQNILVDKEVQVGMKLIPQVLKLSQIPVKNMKLESSFSSSGQRESLSLQSVRCPAEVAMKSELCDDSGIVICSLDQSGEIEVEMACDSLEPRIGTKEQSFSKQNRVDGWWSRIVSGKTPLSENKSLENATIGKSAEGTITTAQKPIMVENSMFLQAEAILQPETSAHHPNPRYKLVMVDSSIQNTSRSLRSSVSPDRQYSSVSAAKPDWSDRSVQVGVKLTPNSIEVRPLKLENMEAVLTSKTTRVAREVDVSAILCTSGVQYEEELTETTGVQVVQINESADLSLDYCGNKFATSVTSNKKRGSVITSTDRSRQFGVGIIKARTEEPNTTPDADDCEIITTLRVKEAQYTTKNNLTGGYWEGTRTPSEETAFVRRQNILVDKDVQVGLNLIPKAVTVDKVSVENMEVINEQRKHGIFEQVNVGAMLCSRPTQYDQILTESKGVHVLPIRDAHDVQVGYDGETFYTTVDSRRDFIGANYSGSRNDLPRLRVHHLEFSAEAGRIKSIDKSRESSKADRGTQVGAILIPTELKLQQMSLDVNQVPRLVESISAKNILCPTDIGASSILSECSGVQIASVRGMSEISLRLGQAEYNAEVQRDTQSNETRIAIRERSISATRSFASGYVSLIEPSSSIGYIQQTQPFSGSTSSILRTTCSKSVQVGTILIPTAVTMSKVLVNNLEVSVPLNQTRSAEISVSAVLASSATEMTSVLTNTPGIHVIPMSKVDEIGIQVNGKNYIGMVEGSSASLTTGAYQLTGDRSPSSISMSQDQQKIVLPIASLATSGSADTQSSLLRQSADLSLVRDALRSGQVTPDLREVNTLSTGSFRRPGILHIPGQTLTPIAEISSTSSHTANKDATDSSVQVGVRLIPHTVSVQRISKESIANVPRNLSEEETDILKVLYSSEFQYEQILQESVGIDMVPIKYAENVNVTLGGERIITSVGLIRSDRQNLIFDQPRGLLDRAISPPKVETTSTLSKPLSRGPVYAGGSVTHEIIPSRSFTDMRSIIMCSQSTQVGVILYPQQISLERMNLETGSVDSMARLNESRTQSVLYPTNMGVDVALCEAPGLQMADFGGNVSVDFGDSLYNANITRTASTADASVHLINKSVSPGRKSSTLEISLSRQSLKASITAPSADLVRRYTVSTATQVGILLVPSKVCMNKIDVEHLAVEIPTTEWKSTDMNVSAILASTGTEMIPVLSEDAGIQVVDMKDLEELGIQYGDDVYVASVVGSKPKYITGTYGPARDNCVATSSSNKRREVIFISVPKNLGNAQMNRKAANLLSQSADLREIHSSLSSSVAQPRLRMESALATPIRFGGLLGSQKSMTTRVSEPTALICECGRHYTRAELERQLILIESGAIGASGQVNSQFSTTRPLHYMPVSHSPCGSQDTVVAEASKQTSAYTGESRRQITSTEISNQPPTTSLYSFGHSGIICNCGRHLEAVNANSHPVEITCSACGARNVEVVGKLRGKAIFTCDCGIQYASGDISKLPITLSCSLCGSSGTVVINSISSPGQVYESYHVTCEAGIKPDMVSKRLTVNIRPIGIDADCQVNTYEQDYSVGTRIPRNQFSYMTPDDMASDLMEPPNLIRRAHSKKRTHSEESHERHRNGNICSICRNRMMITAISSADPDDPNSYEASIRIRRVSNADTFDNSISTNLSRGSTLRRSFFTRGSDKRSSGSFESLRSQSVASKCAICHNEITSGDLSSSIRTSTSSLIGTAAATDTRVKDIADAYARICRGADRCDGEQANLYHLLRNNRIVQAIIDDYEKEKNSEEGRYFVEAKEIAKIVSTTEKVIGKVTNEDKTAYSQLRHNSVAQKVISSYESYKYSMRVDEFIQTTLIPVRGEVASASDDVQEIIDTVSAFENAKGQIGAGRTLYTELKGNPIIQRMIKEYEVDRFALASIQRPPTSSHLISAFATRDSKVGILSVDGQMAKMESEQFTTSDSMTGRSTSILRRHKGNESREKPLSSSVSSVSGDEDGTDIWRTTEQITLTSVRYDVAVSALITPETWDKKVQFDSSNPR
ncbi:hypothetical protein ACTXT7_001178 [Hymenolepis weldensis]